MCDVRKKCLCRLPDLFFFDLRTEAQVYDRLELREHLHAPLFFRILAAPDTRRAQGGDLVNRHAPRAENKIGPGKNLRHVLDVLEKDWLEA